MQIGQVDLSELLKWSAKYTPLTGGQKIFPNLRVRDSDRFEWGLHLRQVPLIPFTQRNGRQIKPFLRQVLAI